MAAVLAEQCTNAGIRRIHNHDIMGCTAEGVAGNRLYSGRVLGATEPGEIIQLHPALAPEWPAIREHYRRIGLTHTEQVIWDTDRRLLSHYPTHAVSVFFFGSAEHAARPDQDWFRTVETINCKNAFMEAANRLGMPVPTTLAYAAVADIGAADIAAAPYPCYLKAAVSVSGVGIYRCEDEDALSQAVRRFDPDTPVQVQQEVIADTFLNMQYEASSDGLHRLAATEQILDGCVPQGNRFPARCEPWHIVEPMARWLHSDGMRGVFAFDVAVVGRDGTYDYLAIECNPRYNGASYPTAVANKLGIDSWLARVFETDHRTLSAIDLDGIEYDSVTGEGVVLVNWGPILVGKILVLLAGDAAAQARLTQALNERL
jgi:hypothetical protein